jgi:hypothetical protein
MAKDRFSKFKKSNYDKEFRYGNNSMNWNIIPDRQNLNNEQRAYIVNLIKTLPNESDKNFLRSIIQTGKVPTIPQRNIIKSMIDKNKTNKL